MPTPAFSQLKGTKNRLLNQADINGGLHVMDSATIQRCTVIDPQIPDPADCPPPSPVSQPDFTKPCLNKTKQRLVTFGWETERGEVKTCSGAAPKPE